MIRLLVILLLPMTVFAQTEELPWLRSDKPEKAAAVDGISTLTLAYDAQAVNLNDGHAEKLNKWFKDSYQHVDIKVETSSSGAGSDWRSVGLMRGTEVRAWLIDSGIAASEINVSVEQGEQDQVLITPGS